VEGYFYADTFKAYRAPSDPSRRCRCTPAEESCASRRVPACSRRVDGSRLAELLRHRRRAAVGGTVLHDSDDAVVVISEGYRRRIFGNGPGIGEAIKVNGAPATVIGVAADGFDGLQFDGLSTSSCPSR
jgi:hypothetical protein